MSARSLDLARLVGLETARRAARDDRRSHADVMKLLRAVEAEVEADPAGSFAFDPDGFATLRTTKGAWAAGRFTTPTLDDLEARVRAMPGTPGAGVTLSVLLGTDPLCDIGLMQASSDGHALFQVASQWNALEAPGPHGLVDVSEYPADPTQGPRASISAFPGTFLRHHRAPRADGSRFGQTDAEQVELLGLALPPDVARATNGYLRTEDVRDPARAAAALEADLGRVRVGLHEAVEVVLGHDWGGPVTGVPSAWQVFTSTLALGYSGRRPGPHDERLMQLLLRAAYLGTLLAAVATGRARAVLTLIGGGVFGNPHRAIWEAMLWACDRVAALSPAPLDVVLNGREQVEGVKRDALLGAIRQRGGVLVELDRESVRVTR